MRKFYLLLIFLIFALGCQKEDYSLEESVPVLHEKRATEIKLKNLHIDSLPEQVHLLLKKSQAKNNQGFNHLNFATNVIELVGEDGISTYTLAFQGTSNKFTQKSAEGYYFDNLVIRFDKEPKTFIIRYEPTLEWQHGTKDFNNFRGKISFYTPEGEKINSLFNPTTSEKKETYKSIQPECIFVIDHVVSVCSGNSCRTTYYLREYCSSSSNDDNDRGGGEYTGGPSDPESIPTVPIEGDPDFGNDGPGGGGPSNPDPTEGEDSFNVMVDSSIYQYPCLAEVLNQVLGSDSDLFTETIGRFIDNPKYDLTYTVGECDNTEVACTNGSNVNTTGNIVIKFEDTNQTPINFVATILHESIHAEIFRYVNEHHNGYIDPNDKPRLFDYFKYYKLAVDQENIDHPYMAAHYITPIAEALRKLDNNNYSVNYYKVFALEGIGNWGIEENDSIMENYGEFRNEVSNNFSITCDD